MENEIWKDIPGCDGYQASTLGRIKGPRKILKFYISTKYFYAPLTLNGICRGKTVHRLVYRAFHGEIPSGYVIDHINNNSHDNRPENLQLLTIRANTAKDTPKKKNGGLTGAFYNKGWYSKIWINGKPHKIGKFNSEIEAHQAYINKLREIEHK